MGKPTALKVEIVRRGLSQVALAQTTGIEKSRLNRILNGLLTPHDYERKALAQALEIPLSDLPA